ncbi:MAG: EthD family reductase [Trebonia sp.]
MTTLVRLAKRFPGLAIDDFRRQADRASDWSSAERFGLRGAIQSLTLAGAYRGGEPACDAIDELTFDDEADAARCLADPAFRRAWACDLLDPASVACLLVEEHVAKPGPVPASFVKNYELVTKRPDMDRADFDQYWARVHGPLAAAIPTIRRYVQAHLSPGTRAAGAGPASYDGLAITWFDDVAAMRAGASTEAYARTRADERNFLAGELPFVITTERRVFPRS